MIIGCDPASKKLSLFAIGPITGAFHIEVKRTDRWQEIRELREALVKQLDIWRDYNPVLFCEEPVLAGARNIRSTILIAETVGLVLSMPIPTRLIEVSTWKKIAVGNGHASKDDVSNWLKVEHPGYHHLCGGNQDLIDAAAIAVAGDSRMDPSRSGALQG